jgi:hypothetical protein
MQQDVPDFVGERVAEDPIRFHSFWMTFPYTALW